jgi:thymidylate synthase (FAD)
MTVKLLSHTDLKVCEYAARTSHNSLDKLGTNPTFIASLVKKGHLSILEHASATFEVQCSTGCASQLCRHRLLSIVQQSTRYVGMEDFLYFKPDFDNPYDDIAYRNLMSDIKRVYYSIKDSEGKDTAKYLLPQATMTKLVVTANLRTWKEFLPKRLDKSAHFEIRSMAESIQEELIEIYPELEEVL